MRRSAPLKRSGPPKRRKPLAQQSKQRRAEREERAELVAERKRYFGICLLRHQGGCQGELVGHELVKRSQLRGAHLRRELVITLCVRHNGMVEDYPLAAQAFGVSVPRWAYDRYGQAALDEAARLRGAYLIAPGPAGTHGVPFWDQTHHPAAS